MLLSHALKARASKATRATDGRASISLSTALEEASPPLSCHRPANRISRMSLSTRSNETWFILCSRSPVAHGTNWDTNAARLDYDPAPSETASIRGADAPALVPPCSRPAARRVPCVSRRFYEANTLASGKHSRRFAEISRGHPRPLPGCDSVRISDRFPRTFLWAHSASKVLAERRAS